MTIREILTRRDAIRTDLRGILSAHPDGLPEEHRARADELEAEAARLNDLERRQVLLDELDRRSEGTTIAGTADGNFDRLAAEVSFLDCVRAQMPGVTDVGAGRAREVSAELERRSGRKAQGVYFSLTSSGRTERRTQTTTVNSAGGYLVAEDLMAPIDILRARLIVHSLGATVLGGLQGDVVIPRLTQSSSSFWVADNQQVTPSSLAFDAISLNMRTVGGLLELSRGMVMQPSTDVARLAQSDLTRILAQALDQAAFTGTGTSAQPLGLLNSPDVTTTFFAGGNGGDLTWNSIVAAIASLDTANALDGRLGFATNPQTVSKLRRTLKTTADTSSNFLMTDPGTLAGYPLQSTTLIPHTLTKGSSSGVCSALIFADWSQLIIGTWGATDILVNPYATGSYEAGNIKIRALMSCDINYRHPASFVVMPDVTTV